MLAPERRVRAENHGRLSRFCLSCLPPPTRSAARARIASVNGDVGELHSLPGQHGMFLALFAVSGAARFVDLVLVSPRMESSLIA